MSGASSVHISQNDLTDVRLCPVCHRSTTLQVIDTRRSAIGETLSIRRRIRCTRCDVRYTTIEIPQPVGTAYTLLKLVLSGALREKLDELADAVAEFRDLLEVRR